jgi:hypothetical protein
MYLHVYTVSLLCANVFKFECESQLEFGGVPALRYTGGCISLSLIKEVCTVA